MTSAFVFTAALAFAGVASARSVPSSHTGDKPVAASEEKKAKHDHEKDTKAKADCKHDKNHPCKASDPKSGQAK